MSSALDEVAALCAHTLRTSSLLLRGTPAAAGWVLGWMAAEFAPHVLTGHALSALPSPLERAAAGLAFQRADRVLESVLTETFGDGYAASVHHPLEPDASRRPHVARVIEAMQHRRRYAEATTNISYGPGGRNHLLDIWRRPDLPVGHRAPVLIQVPGGGWSINDKRGQAYPLMSRMVELGWICVSINYSRSPRNAWPAHIIDVKRAIAWVRENIADYGGDPGFIAITGGSAGGHLSSLAALTAGDKRLQPGFEDADTSVNAAAPHYGVYDMTNPDAMHPLMMPLLEHVVMQARFEDNPEIFSRRLTHPAGAPQRPAVLRPARPQRRRRPAPPGPRVQRRSASGRSPHGGLRRDAQRPPRLRHHRHAALPAVGRGRRHLPRHRLRPAPLGPA